MFSVRKWEQGALWVSLAGVVTIAWWYLFVLASDMGSMSEMAGMPMWDSAYALSMFFMWTVMMIGMMVPTAVRAIGIYMNVARTARERGSAIASTYSFVVGYVVTWTLFSVGATGIQAILDNAGLMSGMMTMTSAYLGAGVLIGAGIYQFTPWKDVCLQHCQSPAQYLAGRFGPRPVHGISLGMRHGAYCLGCCWLLMLLLFVGGVMNLLWIAAITMFVIIEKLLPRWMQVTRVSGLAMIVAGLAFFATG